MSHKHTHEEAQAEELAFWNTPGAELGEQFKQITYLRYLDMQFTHDGNSPFVIDKTGLSILDVGGGPVSLLLKTNAEMRCVVDPCEYPEWVIQRYAFNNINFWNIEGENIDEEQMFDEVWMYNVLQHTTDPQKIFNGIYESLKYGGKLRFMDWVDTPTNVAHPISLNTTQIARMIYYACFDKPLEHLRNAQLNENNAVGTIAYGTFTK